MQCAWLIDQDKVDEARQILIQFKEDKFCDVNQEKDIEMVVHSLYGIIAEETRDGNKSIKTAQALLKDFGGKYEQRQWLRLPQSFL